MALTSKQKHYIKKNIHKLSIDEISVRFSISKREVDSYVRKHFSDKIYARVSGNSSVQMNVSTKDPDFTFKKLIIDNLNIIILLFFLVAISYYNSLGNAFVSDDIAAIAKNGNIGNFHNIFLNGITGSTQNFIQFIIFHISGPNPTYFRIFNIITHFGIVTLIFFILAILTNRRTALISAAIFAVHPILTESIAWISGMPYTLSAFFFLLSFLFYIVYRKKTSQKLLYASYVAFAFSLISTQNAIPLFSVFFIWEYVLGGLKKHWKKLTPFSLLGFIWIAMFATKIAARTNALVTQYYQQKTSQSVFVQVPVAIINYLKLMIWPDKLALYHTEMQYSSGSYAFILLLFLCYLAAIIYYWRKNRFIFFWLSFLIIALSATLTPLGVSWVVAERYVYLGSLGIFVVFAIFFNWLIEKSGEKYKYAFYGIMILIVAALSIRTIVRNIDWKNEDNLWIATAKVSPSGAPIHNNLGDVYARRQDYPKAIEEFTKATQINPGYADAYHNLANTYQMTGDVSNATKYYNKALSINPNIWQSYQNLAAIYFDQGNREKALENIQKAIAINPQDQGLQNNLKIIQGEAPVAQPPAAQVPQPGN